MESNLTKAAIRLLGFQITEFVFKRKSQGFDPLVTASKSNLHIENRAKPINEDKSLFVVELEAIVTDESDSFELRATLQTLFKYEGLVDVAFLSSPFVNLNAPAIAYPYLRSFITTVTATGGYNPIILPAINFANAQPREKKSSGE
jgi:preprotein translocase subunit SecB